MLRLHINGDLFPHCRTPALGSQGDNRPVKKSCQQTFYHTSIKATFAKYFKKDNKRSEVKCHRLFIYRNILDRTLKHSHVRSEEEHLSAGEIPPPPPEMWKRPIQLQSRAWQGHSNVYLLQWRENPFLAVLSSPWRGRHLILVSESVYDLRDSIDLLWLKSASDECFIDRGTQLATWTRGGSPLSYCVVCVWELLWPN